MRFEIQTKRFEFDDKIAQKFNKVLGKLLRTLNVFSRFQNTGSIVVENFPKKHEFLAKIKFRLPRHFVYTEVSGPTPEQALHRAIVRAKGQVLKVKDKFKDIHAKQRRAKK